MEENGLQVKYKEVMKQYNLGPNGGILTSLNLFATRFDQVLPCSCPHPGVTHTRQSGKTAADLNADLNADPNADSNADPNAASAGREAASCL